MNIQERIYTLHPLARKVLPVANLESADEMQKVLGLDTKEVQGGLNFLIQEEIIERQDSKEEYYTLDKFGEKYVGSDLPEIQVLKALKGKTCAQSKLGLDKEVFASALGVLKRNKLIEIAKDQELMITPTDAGKEFVKKHTENPLTLFAKPVSCSNATTKQQKIVDEFKMRKGFIKKVDHTTMQYHLTANGKKIHSEYVSKYKDVELVETLTSDMLKTKSYENKEFRWYNTDLETPVAALGRRHPMMQANDILRSVFVDMGFKEMRGPMVESAFWNMDSMWIPQDHPAREEQDTFYLEGKCDVDQELVDKVKDMHEQGMLRTHTQKDEWSQDITQKQLLRTHSTATSFRVLHELSKKHKAGEDINGKYFYIANVFRNEAVDATHLAEFFQGEGFIIGDNLSLADLMGFVKEYYAKLGIDQVKFKPTFNPYTEPSMEAHMYDEEIGKWYALINSGIFRPETLKPFGLQDKTIIAWGMGASRIAAKLAQKVSMRDITGMTCDLGWLQTRPVMRKSIVQKKQGGKK